MWVFSSNLTLATFVGCCLLEGFKTVENRFPSKTTNLDTLFFIKHYDPNTTRYITIHCSKNYREETPKIKL